VCHRRACDDAVPAVPCVLQIMARSGSLRSKTVPELRNWETTNKASSALLEVKSEAHANGFVFTQCHR
jgi:hypothetical protein